MFTYEDILTHIVMRQVYEYVVDRVNVNKIVKVHHASFENFVTTKQGGFLPFEAYFTVDDGNITDRFYIRGVVNYQGFVLFNELFKNDVGVPREDGWRF